MQISQPSDGVIGGLTNLGRPDEAGLSLFEATSLYQKCAQPIERVDVPFVLADDTSIEGVTLSESAAVSVDGRESDTSGRRPLHRDGTAIRTLGLVQLSIQTICSPEGRQRVRSHDELDGTP